MKNIRATVLLTPIFVQNAAAIMDLDDYEPPQPQWPVISEDGSPIILDPPLLKAARERGNTLILFHAPWCSHCVELEPEFEKASKLVTDGFLNATLATFDCAEHSDHTSSLELRGFPTMRWYTMHGDTFDYNGPRKGDVIAQWIKFMKIDPITDMVQLPRDRDIGTGRKDRVVVSLVAPERTPAFERIALKYRTEAKWGFVATGDSGMETKVVLRKRGEEAVVSYDVGDKEKLDKFFLRERLPSFGELSQESFPMYKQQGEVGLVYVLFQHANAEELQQQIAAHRKEVEKLAKRWWEKFAFVWVDTVSHAETLKTWFNIQDFPAVVITGIHSDSTNSEENRRYILPELFSFQKVDELLQGIQDQTVSPNFKTEDVPESQPDPVLKIVGRTIMSELFRPDRDFFLEVFAPWCVHCRGVKKQTNVMGELIRDMGATDLLAVGRINGQANDSPNPMIKWEHFPTLMFVKAGSMESVLYEGERSAHAMLRFVSERTDQKQLQKAICSLFAKNCEKASACGPDVCRIYDHMFEIVEPEDAAAEQADQDRSEL